MYLWQFYTKNYPAFFNRGSGVRRQPRVKKPEGFERGETGNNKNDSRGSGVSKCKGLISKKIMTFEEEYLKFPEGQKIENDPRFVFG